MRPASHAQRLSELDARLMGPTEHETSAWPGLSKRERRFMAIASAIATALLFIGSFAPLPF